jgi:26S proteasome regulatory subunit T5
MFVGEGSRLVRNAFELARTKAPSIIFIDEIDAIGGKRRSIDGLQGEREVQRTLLELLNQLDGFSSVDNVKVICAINRPDVLDPALMRSGSSTGRSSCRCQTRTPGTTSCRSTPAL